MSSDTSTGSVIVGLDGSDHARRAVSWAAANTTGPIRLVVAWSLPWWGTSAPLGGVPAAAPPPDSYFENEAKEVIAEVRSLLGDVETLPSLVRRGHSGQTLTDVANDEGRMLVVGSRGRGAVARTLLGSTSAYCAAHCDVPVVIVPDGGDIGQARRIVVGIDGSENADAALLWAIDHAPVDATIVATAVWAPPMSYDGVLLVELDELEARHRALANEAVARAEEARPDAANSIEIAVEMGDARNVLRSSAADQIVVGARGHTGLDYLLMGSTASALVHHPTVPTVIVPSN